MNRFPPVWCLLSSESELDQPALAGFFLSMSTLSATNLRQCRRVDWQVWTVALKLGYIMDEAVWGPTGSFQGPWNQNSNPWTKLPQNPLLQTYWGQKCYEEIWEMWNAHPRSELEALATSTEMLALWPVSVEKKLTFAKSGVRYLQKSHLLWFNCSCIFQKKHVLPCWKESRLALVGSSRLSVASLWFSSPIST